MTERIGWGEGGEPAEHGPRSAFQPRDPAFVERVRASFARQRFMETLGASIPVIEPGYVVVEVPFRPELTQQHGFLHAGVTSSAADNAGGYAGYTLFPADSSVLTVEFKINLLAPAKGDLLSAVGQVLRTGRTLTVCDLKVFAVDGRKRSLCASGQQTLICLEERRDG